MGFRGTGYSPRRVAGGSCHTARPEKLRTRLWWGGNPLQKRLGSVDWRDSGRSAVAVGKAMDRSLPCGVRGDRAGKCDRERAVRQVRVGLIRACTARSPFPKGANMSTDAVRILVVGTSTASTESTLKSLARSGWESHSVKTVREAETVLRTIRFQVTLATEKLPDGTGYELASLIVQQTGNLFISVPLSETCLWLPAVENGVRSLGQRALNPLTLGTEAAGILRTRDIASVVLESERNRRSGSSGEVVRAEVARRVAAGVASSERFGREGNQASEHGKDAISSRTIAARRHELAVVEKTREPGLRLVSEDVVWDLEVPAKRWRGL